MLMAVTLTYNAPSLASNTKVPFRYRKLLEHVSVTVSVAT